MSIIQRGKSNSIKELLVKFAKREHLDIPEGDSTPFSVYASAWLERKKATLARSTYGDYRSIWKKYVLPYFGNTPLSRVTRLDVEEFLGNLPDISYHPSLEDHQPVRFLGHPENGSPAP